MRRLAQPNPLTDTDSKRLGDFLNGITTGRAMHLEAMDGFLAAVICGPEILTPRECLPHISGMDDSTDRLAKRRCQHDVGIHTVPAREEIS